MGTGNMSTCKLGTSARCHPEMSLSVNQKKIQNNDDDALYSWILNCKRLPQHIELYILIWNRFFLRMPCHRVFCVLGEDNDL